MDSLFSKSKSCSVVYNSRPLRIAFFVDPHSTSDELLDSIVEFSLEKWGGRYFPIIPCDGSSITHSFWTLLEFSDPDIIYSFVKLDNELIEKIDRSIAPFGLYVKVPNENQSPLQHDSYLENPLPNEFLIKEIPKIFLSPFYSVKSQLSVFKMDSNSKYFGFILRNFGYLKYLLQFYMKHGDSKLRIELKDIYKEIDAYEIDGDTDLSGILEVLKSKRNLIYPMFLSEIPGSPSPVGHKYRDRGFLIGIDDSILTYLYLWNRIHILDHHLKRSLSQLLITNDILQNDKLLESIKDLIKNNIYQDSYGQYELRLVSASKSRSELSDIADFLKKDTYWRIDIGCSKEDFGFPKIENTKHTPISYKQSGNIENFNDTSTLIPNKGPIPIKNSSTFHSYNWMMDVDLSYRPERFFYTNVEYWWKLPRRSGITYLFNRTPSRVTKQGSLSFLANSNEKSFKITIPNERSVFFQLISPYYNYVYKSDVRKKKVIEFNEIKLSDKGLYLDGVLGLFPSLWHAHNCFSENFWRNIFRYLSNIKDKKERNQLEQLKGKVKKALTIAIQNYHKDTDSTIEYLTSSLHTLMREEKYERVIDFDYFFDLAKNEREAFLSTTKRKDEFAFTDEELEHELKNAIQDLLDSNILFQGIRPKCRYCGFRNWFDLNEIKTELICKGCHTKFKFPAEIKWFYKSNELISRTILYQGVMATLMCLGHLLEESRESFIFIPSSCLFKEYDDQDSLAEIDIICISDGNFIIGEVKNSAKLFSQADFNKIEKIALKIRPDKVVIYALEGPYENALKLTENLKAKISPYAIDVSFIKPSEHIKEPSYHIGPF